MKTKFRSKGKMSISHHLGMQMIHLNLLNYISIIVDILRVGTNKATWINEHGLDTVTALKTDWAGGQCSAGVVTVLVQMSTNVGPSLAALA